MNIDFNKTASSILGLDVGNRNKPQEVEVTTPPIGEKKVLLAWEALSRPHMSDNGSNRMTRTFTIIGVVIAFVLIILQEFLLLLVIGSMIFVSYVLTKVPPEKINYTITTHGITVGEKIYYWADMMRFYFTERDGSHVLAVDLKDGTSYRMFINYLAKDRAEIEGILKERLVYLEKEPKNAIDRGYDSLMSKLNVK